MESLLRYYFDRKVNEHLSDLVLNEKYFEKPSAVKILDQVWIVANALIDITK